MKTETFPGCKLQVEFYYWSRVCISLNLCFKLTVFETYWVIPEISLLYHELHKHVNPSCLQKF